jgi:hypothetical protein
MLTRTTGVKDRGEVACAAFHTTAVARGRRVDNSDELN